jgi:hypothetical protein
LRRPRTRTAGRACGLGDPGGLGVRRDAGGEQADAVLEIRDAVLRAVPLLDDDETSIGGRECSGRATGGRE